MTEFYKFASESPYLTFFLAYILGHTIVASLALLVTLVKKTK